jgi:two-component system response regulator DesR
VDTQTEESPIRARSGVNPLRILIADDCEAVRRVIRKHLSDGPTAWCVCGEARDGEEALTKAAELQPDVVLLDFSLPKLSGLEVARRLAAEHPACAIVLMSAQDPELLRRIAAAAGLAHSFPKTSVQEALVPTLESILGGNCGVSGASSRWLGRVRATGAC